MLNIDNKVSSLPIRRYIGGGAITIEMTFVDAIK